MKESLRKKRENYFGPKLRHVDILTRVVNPFGRDLANRSPQRAIVLHLGGSPVQTMELVVLVAEMNLGLASVLPPPGEVRKVDTATGAAGERQARQLMP